MSGKHTPGEWHAVDPMGAFSARFVIVAEGRDDAIIASVGGDMPEEEANARLIAAAPELLEALKLGMGSNGHFSMCLAGQRGQGACSALCEAFKAALAKAEGSPEAPQVKK